LRSGITFDQASRAKEAGFRVEMLYVALESFDLHLERVRIRADAGGHAAPASVLRGIYLSSLANLPRAMREIPRFFAYDNSEWQSSPKLLLAAEHGRIEFQASALPAWLRVALIETRVT
jgi:predicted ABC-type ATPase